MYGSSKRGLALVAPLACAPDPAAANGNWCGYVRPHSIKVALERASDTSDGVSARPHDAQLATLRPSDREPNSLHLAMLTRVDKGVSRALCAAQGAWSAFDRAQGEWSAWMPRDQGISAVLNPGGAALERQRARVCDLTRTLNGARNV